METKKNNKLMTMFDGLACRVTKVTGSSTAFVVAFLVIIVWAVTGPIFHYSDTWQLVINTGTTIITFLMVFIIQHSANKDTVAIHLKLNELIASQKTASNRLVSVEDLTDAELEVLKKFYSKLGKLAKEDKELFATHSIDEANEVHHNKRNERHPNKQ